MKNDMPFIQLYEELSRDYGMQAVKWREIFKTGISEARINELGLEIEQRHKKIQTNVVKLNEYIENIRGKNDKDKKG
jgi:hypothetical protein